MKKDQSTFKENDVPAFNDIIVPPAKKSKDYIERVALVKAIEKIERAKCDGRFTCYMMGKSYSYFSKAIFQKLLDAGYDITHYGDNDSHSLGITVSWKDRCDGTVYKNENTKLSISSVDELCTIMEERRQKKK